LGKLQSCKVLDMKHNPIQLFLNQQKFILLDGALATELETRGADLRDPLWSAKLLLENPDLIQQVHYDYFMAGADIAISASYQATFQGFAQRGLNQQQAAELMHLSVQLACQARDEFWSEPKHHVGRNRPLVAASIGPYGAYLADGSEYQGDYGLTISELKDFHRPRMATLVASGPDLLACETIPCPQEAIALIELLAEFPESWAWLCFSCRDTAHVCQGEPFAESVALANECDQIVAVGVNCTNPAYVECLLTHAAKTTTKPLITYPNSGEVWHSADHSWLANPHPQSDAQQLTTWYNADILVTLIRTTTCITDCLSVPVSARDHQRHR